jgi:beta-glucosidase
VAEQVVGQASHKALALEAAVKTITLLKNDGNVLPLDAGKRQTIAVIGPNANRPLLGGYSGVPHYAIGILEGIRTRAGSNANVVHAEGCRITIGGSWNVDDVTPADPDEDRRMIAEAVEVAKGADVIVLALGGNEQTSREAWSRKHMGDRTSLDLVGRQDELLAAMKALGKPVIVVLVNGRPLSVTHVADQADAILECWYLGQEAGTAVAQTIFGDANPGGKLPISVPRSVGHIPAFYNHKPSARRGYLFDDTTPLYAFGFGLSYTSFSLSAPRLAAASIAKEGSTSVSVDVTNTGKRAGSEVVQLYIRDLVSSVTRPVKELKAFERVTLEPGETRTVKLPVTPDSLAFHDIDMHFVVEPGEFALLVGTSSRDEDLQRTILNVTR